MLHVYFTSETRETTTWLNTLGVTFEWHVVNPDKPPPELEALGFKGNYPFMIVTCEQPSDHQVRTLAFCGNRRSLPDERQAITHNFMIAGHTGYLTVGLYQDGTLGEIFITMYREEPLLNGTLDALASSVSLALQYGVPLNVLAKKFIGMRYDPSGITTHRDIPMAKSIVDYIFIWLVKKFCSPGDCNALLNPTTPSF